MTQTTAPHFNFQPHIEAYQRWEEFKQIRQAQLGVPTRISTQNVFTWVINLARVGYDTLEKKSPGSSAAAGSLVLKRKRVNKKVRAARDRAA
jgi:hypothetical protein